MENRVNQHQLPPNRPDGPDRTDPDRSGPDVKDPILDDPDHNESDRNESDRNSLDLDDADSDDPTDRPELAHLRPDRIRIGTIGVFAGDWAWTPDAEGAMRIPVAFVGTLVDRWNGWAVFACTRQVAQAI